MHTGSEFIVGLRRIRLQCIQDTPVELIEQ
jgi:hypothetical protein